MSHAAPHEQSDPFDLQRFVAAQASVYDDALAEVRAGRKRTHWMWFIFPQLAGLGSSSTAQRFAIQNAAEAIAYLAHPVLGPRLRDICDSAVNVPSSSALAIFGSPDDFKLRSCATLFHAVAPHEPCFAAVLNKFYSGEGDARTLQLLTLE